MRHRHKRLVPRPTAGTPWPRIITLIGMLLVMFMIMNRAKDPATWQWLTNEIGAQVPEEELADSDDEPGGGSSAVPQTAQSEPGSTDLDRDEMEAASEEFQAISDRAPLLAEEMPSYWRLINWVLNQPRETLERRSRKSTLFTDLVQEPDKYRGKLVHLRLHVMRSLTYETPENPLGVKRLYEAWGWTDEAYPWLYAVVFPERPEGMPIGPDARSEVTFDGYFMKLMSYEAHKAPDKPIFAPLLIGRVHFLPVRPVARSDGKWFWIVVGVGGAIVLLGLVRWLMYYRAQTVPGSPGLGGDDSRSVESWLQQAESQAEPDGFSDDSEREDTLPP